MTETIICPHRKCGKIIDMTDGERIHGHVTYWGEDAPTSLDCPHCEQEIFLQEHVTRSWTPGRSPQEAQDI